MEFRTYWTLNEDLSEAMQVRELIKLEDNEKMASISEAALNYKPAGKTKNISDLQEVSTDLNLEDDSFEYDGKIVNQQVVIVDGEKYRVPKTVMQQLQIMLKDNPGIKKFKVIRSGSTKEDTRYTVVPMVAP